MYRVHFLGLIHHKLSYSLRNLVVKWLIMYLIIIMDAMKFHILTRLLYIVNKITIKGRANRIQDCQTYRTLCLWERFFLLFDFILIGQFSSHFRLEKQEKSLSQAKCPISLAVLLGSFSTVPLSLNCRSGKSFDAVESATLFLVKCCTQMCHTDFKCLI